MPHTLRGVCTRINSRQRAAGRHLAQAALTDRFAEFGAIADGGWLARGPNELLLEVSPGGRALVDAVRVVPLEAAR